MSEDAGNVLGEANGAAASSPTGLNSTGLNSTGLNSTGPNPTGPNPTGLNSTGPNPTEPNPAAQKSTAQNSSAPPLTRTAARRRDAPVRGGQRQRLRAAGVWTAAVALLAAAWFVLAEVPPTIDKYAPFAVSAEFDESLTLRVATLTVHEPVVATTVTGERANQLWSAEGSWVVLDVDAVATEKNGTMLTYARLVIDGNDYTATTRIDSLLNTALLVDFSKTASLAFELTPDLVERSAVLKIAQPTDGSLGTVVLDEVVTIPIDLASLPRVDEAEILPEGWTE